MGSELYEILQLRSDVFVIEQECIYRDLDDKDQKCYHLMGFIEDTDQCVAYSRIVPPHISYEEPSIGRVLTALDYRKHQFGKELMQVSISEIKKRYPNQSIRISAQVYLIKFYNSFGFKEIGESYDEDGIEHIEMRLNL
jgi:ElaA protein